MKHLFSILIIISLVGCVANQQNIDDCEIPELSGKSCVEPDYEKISEHPFGTSGNNPVRVDGPKGQRDYLARLICPDDRAVMSFSRAGSVGVGPYGFMMDLYNIECLDKTYSVYLDMYHPNHIENEPIDGFSIKH